MGLAGKVCPWHLTITEGLSIQCTRKWGHENLHSCPTHYWATESGHRPANIGWTNSAAGAFCTDEDEWALHLLAHIGR